MIIGNGQLAQVFRDLDLDDVIIFASGVPDSTCVDIDAFNREKTLLLQALVKYKKFKFVYFSSCALSAEEYPKNMYYNHKLNMEELIKSQTNDYYIFRLPQLFGSFKKHKTLINFFYYSIINDKPFNVFDGAYRYVIEVEDIQILVKKFLELIEPGILVDIANPYRYKVEDIVKIFECLLMKKADYKIVKKTDQYHLNLDYLTEFIEQNQINVVFDPHYLERKLKKNITNL